MTQPNMSIEQFLNQGGGKAFKFTNIGDAITGIISNQKLAPVFEYDNRTKSNSDVQKTDKNGAPVFQLVLTLEKTGLADPADPDDDGMRNVYGGDSWRFREALTKALRAKGVRQTEIGGQVTVVYSGDEELPPGEKRSAAKEYTISYLRPDEVLGSPVGGSTVAQETPAQTPVQQAPVQQAPVQAAAPAGPSIEEQIAALQAQAAQQAAAAAPAPAPAAQAPAPAAGQLTPEAIEALKKLGIAVPGQ